MSDTNLKQIQKLAVVLATGAKKGYWSNELKIDTSLDWEFSSTYEGNLRAYLRDNWNDQLPDLKLLKRYGYIEKVEGDPGEDSEVFALTDKAFALV